MTIRNLEKGQIPFRKLTNLRTAHDVRKIRICAHCQQVGLSDSMIDAPDKSWWHGRCLANKFGLAALLRERPEKLNRLSLGDLGVKLSRAVVEHLDKSKSS